MARAAGFRIGSQYLYKLFGLDSVPPDCATSVIDREGITVWGPFSRPEEFPRTIVRFGLDGVVQGKKDCEYNAEQPDKTVVRKIQVGCKPTDYQKIGSVNPNKLKEFIKTMLPANMDHIQFLVHQSPHPTKKVP